MLLGTLTFYRTLSFCLLATLFLLFAVPIAAAAPSDMSRDAIADSFDPMRFARRQRASRAKPKAFVALFGGYNSCRVEGGKPTPIGSERWHRLRSLVTKHAGEGARWLISCWDDAGTMHFTSSTLAPRLRQADGRDLSALTTAIKRESDDGKLKMYVAGHSHGGWTVLQAVKAQAKKRPVRALMTVDPISAIKCNADSFWGPIWRPWAEDAYFPDCRRAPRDVDLKTVKARVTKGRWLHYYQLNFYPLHSSEYAGKALPDLSQDLSSLLSLYPPGIKPSYNAHVTIDDLDTVWLVFSSFITKDLK